MTVSKLFNIASGGRSAKRGWKASSPLSVRVSAEERARLKEAAGPLTLSAYMRQVLLGENAEPSPRRKRVRVVEDYEAASKLLSALGRSNIANNLNQIARAVNCGALPVTPETEADLNQACLHVAAMRDALIKALGLKGGAS